MFARVIPILRTRVGMDEFDYAVPDQTYQVGDLVWIPFRNRTIIGIIASFLEESSFGRQTKFLSAHYQDINLGQMLPRLVKAVAQHTLTSEATVAKAWLRDLPRRALWIFLLQSHLQTFVSKKGALRSVFTTSPIETLVHHIQEAKEKEQRVLVITPWITRLKLLNTFFIQGKILHGKLSSQSAFKIWRQFVQGESRLLFTTRIGAWLSLYADIIVIDEPENDDHKQDELTPRYDARYIAKWCVDHAEKVVEEISVTPRLSRSLSHAIHAPTISLDLHCSVLHPHGKSSIPCVQSDVLLSLQQHAGPRVIFHPIRGIRAKFVCRDCGWRAICSSCAFALAEEESRLLCHQCGRAFPLIQNCMVCDGTKLSDSTPGIEMLKRVWHKQFPEITVEWRDIRNESMDRPLPPHACVVFTQPWLLGGASEDVRRKERQCQAFRRLACSVANADGILWLQCQESGSSSWKDWLSSDGVHRFLLQERQQRELFAFPPCANVVKVVFTGDASQNQAWQHHAKSFLPHVYFRGPYAVLNRPGSSQRRFIWHLIFPQDFVEAAILRQLRPIAGTAIFDLDPVALFK